MTLTWKPKPDARWSEESLYAGSIKVASYAKSIGGGPAKGFMVILLPGFASSQSSTPFEWGVGLDRAKAGAEEMVRRWFAKATS